MADALVSLQVLPRGKTDEEVYALVDKAIEVIRESGVPYEVGPMETTMEGELPELLAIIERMNEAMIEMGCPSVLHQVKIYFNPAGASIRGLTGKYDEKQ